jgi:hypothetical protein
LRYACSVIPNFNFCETCEETRDHEHAFFKVKPEHSKLEVAPKQPLSKQEKIQENPALMKNWKEMASNFC